jgi:hypothetical protein
MIDYIFKILVASGYLCIYIKSLIFQNGTGLNGMPGKIGKANQGNYV